MWACRSRLCGCKPSRSVGGFFADDERSEFVGHTVDIVAREKGNLRFKVTTQEATGSYDNTPADRRRAVEVRSTITPDH